MNTFKRGLAVGLALVLAGTLGSYVPASAADPAGRLESAQRAKSVRAQAIPVRAPLPDGTAEAAKATAARPAPVWPEPGTTDITLADGGQVTRAARTPVTVAAESPSLRKVRVQVLSQASAQAAGIRGLLMRVGRNDGALDATPLAVTVDYNAFRHAYGADWASRLRVFRMPDCALTTPADSACQGEELASSNSIAKGTVSATVRAEPFVLGAHLPGRHGFDGAVEQSAGTLIAVMAASSGSAGDFGATTLAASSTWGHTGSSGGFTWSYPMRTPPANGGPVPNIGLSYSSQSVDGRHAASNNQPGWIGEGFSYDAGFIERRYKSCVDDMGGGANNTVKTGDLCWGTENAVMSLAGSSSELIKAADGTWHAEREDGSKVELLTGGPGGGHEGQYWRVTNRDGTTFWFGRHRLPGWTDGKLTTDSVLTVPVAGNNAGEPCHAATFAASFCDQPYRWNLDYVEDVYGNTMSLWYGRDLNYYARNKQTSTPVAYYRDGYLKRIDYGTDKRTGTDSAYTATAPQSVEFTSADRCLANCGVKNATTWPDVPFDQECGATGTCNNVSPTFWSIRRLSKVTTRYWKAAINDYQRVDEWALRQTFPDPGDSTRAGLWLAGITHTGLNGGTAKSLPEITFAGIQMHNRVDTSRDWAPPMNWWRIGSIVTESGGEIQPVYSPRECVHNSVMPAAPDNNWRRCFPVRWTPTGYTSPITDYFHRYVLTEVHQIDRTGGSPPVKTYYEYPNTGNLPLWHHDDEDGIVPDSRKTWGQWRGYPTVITKVGEGTTQQVTQTLYFRGMHGDRLADGSTRSVSVEGMEGGPATDYEQFAGSPREQIVWLDGHVLSATVNTPWRSEPTATRTIGSTVTEARYVRPQRTDGRQALDGGAWRRTANVAEYDAAGRVTFQHDLGEAGPQDDRCTVTDYALANPNGGILTEYPSRVRAWAGPCGTESHDPAKVLMDVKYHHDALSHGSQPTKGSLTSVEALTGIDAQGVRSYQRKGSFTYDAAGRRVTHTDVAGEVTRTDFTPALGGPVTSVKTTNPLTWWTSETLDPGWGLSTTSVDVNGRVTKVAYDALGRRTEVWRPDRPQGQKTPNITYSYTVDKNGPSGVATSVINANDTYNTSYESMDSLLRVRRSQGPAPAGGRVVSDRFYDSAGRVWKINSGYYEEANPGLDLLSPHDADVPTQTRIAYDSAGRVKASILYSKDVEKWRTTTEYHGDHTVTIPPQGAAASTVYTDARGLTTRLRQYHSRLPVGAYDDIAYAYTAGGQLDTVTDPAGNRWDYDYDIEGRLKKTVDPDKGSASITYNAIGQVATTTDARNETLAYTYDRIGRLTSVRDDTATGTLRAEWTYDLPAKGLTRSASRWVNGVKYETRLITADALYRPTQTRVIVPTSEGALAGTYSFLTTYKPDGSPATVEYPAAGGLTSEIVTYEYDDRLGLPKKLKTDYNSTTTPYYVVDAGYTDFGEKAFINRSRDLTGYPVVQSVYNYEEDTHRLARHAIVNTGGGSAYIADASYKYDQVGNVLSIDDNPAGGQRDTQCFQYDSRQQRRLAQAWTPKSYDCGQGPGGEVGGPAPYRQSWTFDSVGNRVTQTEHGSTPAADVTSTYLRPAAGSARPHSVEQVQRRTSTGTTTTDYDYDAAGNTVSRPGPRGQQTLTWDAEGYLTRLQDESGTHIYLYDAAGSRLLAKDPGGTTLHLGPMELRMTGTAVSATRYYAFNGETVAQRTSGGVTWLASDPQGTQQATVSVDGKSVNRRRQTPFGQTRGTTGTWANPKGFVGGHNDPTGLVHIGARQYDADLGSFVSVDPVIDFGDLGQMHAYSYANNSPITFSDPSGLAHTEYDSGGGGGTPGNDGECTTFGCGVVEGFFGQLNIFAALSAIWKTIKDPKGAYNRFKGDAERWGQKLGDELAGWGCALSGLCDMYDACAGSFNAAECGRVVGGLAFQIIVSLGTAGAGGVTAKVASELRDLAAKFDVDIPNNIRDQYDVQGIVNSRSHGGDEGGNLPEERAAQNRGSTTGSDGGGGGGPKGCKHSFDPDTRVLLADGSSKPIDEVENGDQVVATDPETGETSAKQVTALHHNLDTDLTEVTVTNSATGESTILKTTWHHPFWDATAQAWVDAANLEPGHRLQAEPSTEAASLVVTAVHNRTGEAWMHDLTVADIHTYYVVAGGTPVLVHNCTVSAKHDPSKLADSLGDDVFFHYTDEAGHAAIMDGGVVRANSKGVSYFTQDMLQSGDANNVLFAGNPAYAGRGSHMIAFRISPDRLRAGVQPNELVHDGSFRFTLDDVIYHGTNPFG